MCRTSSGSRPPGAPLAARARRSAGLALVSLTAGWVGNAVAAWIGFRLVGARLGLAAVVAIESLVYAARSVAAVIPNALGVQESAYTLVAPLFGVGAEYALAVTVLKRARDIAVAVPVLLA